MKRASESHDGREDGERKKRFQSSESDTKNKIKNVARGRAASQTTPTCPTRTFAVRPPSKFSGNFPFFRRPQEMGHFSLQIDRTFVNDARHLKSYHPPDRDYQVNFDLRKGFESFVKRDDNVKERLNNMMKWVLGNKSLFRKLKKNVAGTCMYGQTIEDELIESLDVDFVAWRGHFTKFLCTPYENREGWQMAATLFRGTVYISEVETKEDLERRQGMNIWEQLCTYGGYKFEQYVTREDGKKSPNTHQPVNNIEAYCSVVRSALSDFNLMYSGEVDCRQPDSKLQPPENYLELKTSRKLYSEKNENNFYRFKLLKWWAQSFLVGIPEVICGFRNDDGVVEELRHFKTLEMHKQSRGAWEASICFNFLEKLLVFFKSVTVIDDPSVVYLFERKPGSSYITYTVHQGEEHRFVPDWYTKEFISMDQKTTDEEAKP